MSDQSNFYSHNRVPQHNSKDDLCDLGGKNKYLDPSCFQNSGPSWSYNSIFGENSYDSERPEESSSSMSAQASIIMSADHKSRVAFGGHHNPNIETTLSSLTPMYQDMYSYENNDYAPAPGATRRDDNVTANPYSYSLYGSNPHENLMYPAMFGSPFPSSRRPGYAGFAQGLNRLGVSQPKTTATPGKESNAFPASDSRAKEPRLQTPAAEVKLNEKQQERMTSPDDYPAYFKSVTERNPGLVIHGMTYPNIPMTTREISMETEAEGKLRKEGTQLGRRLAEEQRLRDQHKERADRQRQKANDLETDGLEKYRSRKVQALESQLEDLGVALERQAKATAEAKAMCAKQRAEFEMKARLEAPMMGNLLPRLQPLNLASQSQQQSTTAVGSEPKNRSLNVVGEEIQVEAGVEDALKLDAQDEELYEDAVDYAEFEEQAMEKKGWLSW